MTKTRLSNLRRVLLWFGLGLFLLAISVSFYPKPAREISLGVLAPPCPGDCNGDQKRDLTDSIRLLRHILGKEALQGDGALNSDLNLDGKINVQDLTILLQHVIGSSPLAECTTFEPETGPRILSVAPETGPSGSQVSLRGWNFAPNPEDNFVVFHSLDSQTQATVLTANSAVLTIEVPPLEEKRYAITVTVAGREAPGVTFDVAEGYQPLVISPDIAWLFMPPGSGQTTMIVGGGTPPYTLQPLDEGYQGRAKVTLTGSTIEIEGIGQESSLVQFKIDDSSDPPQTQTGNVQIMNPPSFSPSTTVTFHSLLQGTAPGLSIKMTPRSRNLTVQQIEIRFPRLEADLSGLFKGRIIGVGQVLGYSKIERLLLMEVTDPVSETEAAIQVIDVGEDQLITVATGSIRKGSASIVVQNEGVLPEQGTYFSYDILWLVTDGIFRIPEGLNQLEVLTEATSVSIHRARDLTYKHLSSQKFNTVNPAAGAPRLERLLPVHGEVGRRVNLIGAGFDPVPENNRVTFAGKAYGSRVEAPVLEIEDGELFVAIPSGAETGPVTVEVNGKTSNPYSFTALFHPTAEMSLPDFTPGTAAAPHFTVEQEDYRDELLIGWIRYEIEGASLDLSQVDTSGTVGSVDFSYLSRDQVINQSIWYWGPEEGETGRHVFAISNWIKIYVSESEGNVIIEMENLLPAPPDRRWELKFEKPFIVPTGASVTVRSEIKSIQWNPIAGTELKIRADQEVGPLGVVVVVHS